MSTNKILVRAFMDALGVAVYAVLFAWFVNNMGQLFGSQPDGWLAFALAIVLFIISASITGSLVLLKPILLYFDGERESAVKLFVYTLVFLAILALVIGFMLGGFMPGRIE